MFTTLVNRVKVEQLVLSWSDWVEALTNLHIYGTLNEVNVFQAILKHR